MIRKSLHCTITAMLILLYSAGSATQKNQGLWSLVTSNDTVGGPIQTGQTIFSFTTPAAGNEISLSISFYEATASPPPQCHTVLLPNPARTYSECIDSAHANKTYYLRGSAVYDMADSLFDRTYITCAKLYTPSTEVEQTNGLRCDSGSPCTITGSSVDLGTLPSEGAC